MLGGESALNLRQNPRILYSPKNQLMLKNSDKYYNARGIVIITTTPKMVEKNIHVPQDQKKANFRGLLSWTISRRNRQCIHNK